MFLKDYFVKAGVKRPLIGVIIGNIFIGLGVGIFKLSMMGNDPFDGMNMALADVTGIYYPVLQIIVNLLLFVIQLLWGRKLIGFGTVINAFLLGYIATFFYNLLFGFVGEPQGFVLRLFIVFLGVLAISLGLSLYQTADLGVAPYDALALIIHERAPKIQYFFARIMCDACCALICFLAGGIVGIGTLVSAFGFGPFIQFFNKTVSEKILDSKQA
ncbi:MAG: hypothetical protein K6E70_10075 [Butyrivibrio sp.]|jgi:uncharacterized membrane protein YczE|nr:hypothetical protein [Butyrivibrio sp.]